MNPAVPREALTRVVQAALAEDLGNAGDVTITNLLGNAVTFENLADGSILPVRCKCVNATGTTATGIVALF